MDCLIFVALHTHFKTLFFNCSEEAQRPPSSSDAGQEWAEEPTILILEDSYEVAQPILPTQQANPAEEAATTPQSGTSAPESVSAAHEEMAAAATAVTRAAESWEATSRTVRSAAEEAISSACGGSCQGTGSCCKRSSRGSSVKTNFNKVENRK